MKLTDILTNKPELVDELLIRIDYHVKSLDFYNRGLPAGNDEDNARYRSIVLKWVQFVEAEQDGRNPAQVPQSDTNAP